MDFMGFTKLLLERKGNNKNGLLFQILKAMIAKQAGSGSKFKNKAMKQKHGDFYDFSVLLLCMVDMGI